MSKNKAANKTDIKKDQIVEQDSEISEIAVNSILDEGKKHGIVKITNNKILYIASNKTYDFTDPEEKIRARFYVILVMKYGYSDKVLDLEVIPPRRDPKLPADIVIYKDKNHTIPYAVVEVKATQSEANIKVAKRQGLGNANLLRANFLLCVCGDEEMTYDVTSQPALKELDRCIVAQLPVNYGLAPQYKFKRGKPSPFGLNEASLNQLKRKFQRCHNIIWDGGKRDPVTSFDEMSKLMFAKIYDEIRATDVGKFYSFQIGTHESPSIVSDRIKKLYQKAQEFEPNIFTTKIELPNPLIFKSVSVMQDISLVQTNLDAKGQAFEEFIGEYFRKKYGQFFTPRQVIQFMIDVVNPSEDDLIIDPACGSGGFLLYVLNHVREKIAKRLVGDTTAIRDLQKDFALKRIFGIEINDKIARIAMMDMVIHEDGHSNIECHDGLSPIELLDSNQQIEFNKYTVCLTNPPFGSDVSEESEYFDKYEFGKKNDPKRKNQKSEILFLERCIDLLKNSGRLGIVLPDSAFSNLGNIEVCKYIFKHCKINAVISLPQFTFTPFGSDAKTSILFAEKDDSAKERYEQKYQLQERIKEIRINDKMTKNEKMYAIEKEKRLFTKYNYLVFMGQIGKVGYDATGRDDDSYFPDVLHEIKQYWRNPSKYQNLYRDNDFWTVKTSFFDLTDKLDVEAYSDEYFSVINSIESASTDVKTLGQIADIYSGWNAPKILQSTEGDVPLIKTANVKKIIQTNDMVNGETLGIINWDRISSFVTINEYNKRKDKQLVINDILVQSVAHSRGYIADKITLVDTIPDCHNGMGVALGKFLIIRIKKNVDVDPMYLAMFLTSPQGKIQLKHYVRGMSAEIYDRDIKEVLVPLPKYDSQKTIGRNAFQIRNSILRHTKTIDSLKLDLLNLLEKGRGSS